MEQMEEGYAHLEGQISALTLVIAWVTEITAGLNYFAYSLPTHCSPHPTTKAPNTYPATLTEAVPTVPLLQSEVVIIQVIQHMQDQEGVMAPNGITDL